MVALRIPTILVKSMPKSKKRDAGAGEPTQLTPRHVSAWDVARLAGVSQSAVSRAFSTNGSVSPKTREKVLSAANELGYMPNLIPRMMLKNNSSLVAVVTGGMRNPFYANIVELFAREIQSRGLTVLLFYVNQGDYFDEAIPHVLGYRVDAIVSALSLLSESAAESCARMRVPVILFNGKVHNEWVATVCSDNVAGGREIANLFLSRGARRFAFISGIKDSMSGNDRLSGYLGGLAVAGHQDTIIVEGGFRYEGGFDAACQLMDRVDRPDAIFCANDLMAIGAMEAIRSKYGLRIPEDVMVAGFDDIPAASWPTLSLTTVRQRADAMVNDALGIMKRMLSGQDVTGGMRQTVATELIERGSTMRKL